MKGLAEHKGAYVALVAIAAGHFIDLPLFEINDFTFSLQKGLSLLFFPFSLLLIGRFYLPKIFLLFGLALLLAFSSAYLISGNVFHANMLKGVFTVLEGFVFAVVFFTALSVHRRSFEVLAQIWIILGCISAVLAIGQTFEFIPFFFVPEEYMSWRQTDIAGIYRGTGLKYDPNYMAMMLLLAIGFAQTIIKKGRWLASLILIAGILSTFSRMGIILLFILFFIKMLLVYREHKRASHVITALSVLFTLLAAYTIAYQTNNYIKERTNDIFNAFNEIHSMEVRPPEKQLSSGSERILLMKTAYRIIEDHPFMGIGAYREKKMIGSMIDIEKSSHNIYLELPMIGGIIGWCVLIISVVGTMKALHTRMSRQARKPTEDARITSMIIIQISIVAISGVFLSFIYYPILWFPLVFSLAGMKSSDNFILAGSK